MSSDEGSCIHCGLPVPAGRRNGRGDLSRPGFCCFGCRIADQLARPVAELERSGRAPSPPSTLLLRLGLGIFLALNIMVASWLSYSREIFGAAASARGADAVLPGLFSYLAFFLCTLLVAMLGVPLLADAARATARVNAQTLIVIGVFSAYLLSAFHTLRGHGSLYYDTAAMVLVIVTLGSYLEAGAKRRAAVSASRLLTALPARVRVRRGDPVLGQLLELPAEQVRVGDLVQIRPGETAPVDGQVVEGSGHVDEASLTGESRPRSVRAGDRLLAGAVSLDGQLWLRAQKVGEETVLALMERSLQAARVGRPRIQRLADRAAAVFVPGVVLLALAVFGYHAWAGRPERGLLDGLAVLLISCPCALGLAAPLASWHGLRRAAEHGILIDSATTLERAAAVRRLFFDKTGTLTRPRPVLECAALAPGIDERQALGWAASLESASTHPIARAFLELAAERDIVAPVPERAAAIPGSGVEGRVDGRTLRLGSARWLRRAAEANHNDTAIFLFDGERQLARFDLAEELRPGAVEVVASLRRMGVEVSIASGDREAPTRRLADRLGVRAEYELLPDDKVRRLAAARESGGGLAMVGDGINDAPVLAAADVGIALGSASDLARRSGNVRLLSDRLDRIPRLLEIARDVRRRIRANLLWAFGFNSLGVGLAAAGWLTPVFAAAAMVASSLTVVRISSRGVQGSSGGAGAEPGAVDRKRHELSLPATGTVLGAGG